MELIDDVRRFMFKPRLSKRILWLSLAVGFAGMVYELATAVQSARNAARAANTV